MEDRLTVSQASRAYGVLTRMPRYYKKLGHTGSVRKAGYVYRAYRPEHIRRLRLILARRKLRKPLKEIGGILADPGPVAAVNKEAFCRGHLCRPHDPEGQF